MKENEIQIGDWVRYRYNDRNGEEIVKDFQVDHLDRLGRAIYVWGKELGNVGRVNQIEPIPLTPEILEKNGFRWTGSGDSTGMLSTPWGFDGIRYNIYVGLKKKTIEVHSAHPELRTDSWRKVNKVSLEVCGCFVHELQHALRLCKIDKEITL